MAISAAIGLFKNSPSSTNGTKRGHAFPITVKLGFKSWIGLENQKEIAESENPYAFYVSDTVDKFQQFAENILTYSAENTMKINIEDY